MIAAMLCPQCGNDAGSVCYRLPVTVDYRGKFEEVPAGLERIGNWCCGACAIREWHERRGRADMAAPVATAPPRAPGPPPPATAGPPADSDLQGQREALGLSQRALARRIGVSRGLIDSIESGHGSPGSRAVVRRGLRDLAHARGWRP